MTEGGDKAVVEVARDGLQAVEAFKNSREGETRSNTYGYYDAEYGWN